MNVCDWRSLNQEEDGMRFWWWSNRILSSSCGSCSLIWFINISCHSFIRLLFHFLQFVFFFSLIFPCFFLSSSLSVCVSICLYTISQVPFSLCTYSIISLFSPSWNSFSFTFSCIYVSSSPKQLLFFFFQVFIFFFPLIPSFLPVFRAFPFPVWYHVLPFSLQNSHLSSSHYLCILSPSFVLYTFFLFSFFYPTTKLFSRLFLLTWFKFVMVFLSLFYFFSVSVNFAVSPEIPQNSFTININ